jgi:transcriptional antiterminator RfaH
MFWTVVTTHPMSERRAITNIARQGFHWYAPREKVTRVVRGRRITDARWMFPRYLFVWIEAQWASLCNTIGIASVLMNGDNPARVPNDWVLSMKARERNGLIDLRKNRFHIGQPVSVTGGLFIGKRGIYQGQTSRQREVILLEALGTVELASGFLR